MELGEGALEKSNHSSELRSISGPAAPLTLDQIGEYTPGIGTVTFKVPKLNPSATIRIEAPSPETDRSSPNYMPNNPERYYCILEIAGMKGEKPAEIILGSGRSARHALWNLQAESFKRLSHIVSDPSELRAKLSSEESPITLNLIPNLTGTLSVFGFGSHAMIELCSEAGSFRIQKHAGSILTCLADLEKARTLHVLLDSKEMRLELINRLVNSFYDIGKAPEDTYNTLARLYFKGQDER